MFGKEIAEDVLPMTELRMLLPDQRIRCSRIQLVEVALAKRSQLDDVADEMRL